MARKVRAETRFTPRQCKPVGRVLGYANPTDGYHMFCFFSEEVNRFPRISIHFPAGNIDSTAILAVLFRKVNQFATNLVHFSPHPSLAAWLSASGYICPVGQKYCCASEKEIEQVHFLFSRLLRIFVPSKRKE